MADGRYDYLETGSLISLKQNVKDIIIPSEEEHLELFPLDFEEFLWALGDETTTPLLRICFEQRQPLGQALHRKIMNDFRQYILVGGMPQVVSEYLKEKDFAAADKIKKRILTVAMKVKFWRFLMKYRGSFQRKKKNIACHPSIKMHVNATMRMHLSGLVRQWW